MKKQDKKNFLKFKSINAKAQIFSTDALVGIVIFLFALGIAFYYFSQISERNNAFEETFELKNSAFNALSVLVETKGFPENWNELNASEIKAFGIVSERNCVDSKKLSKFLEISSENYNEVKKTLGLQKFDFKFSVNDLNGSSVVSAGSTQKQPNTSFKASRLVFWNSKIFSASLEVFK